MVLIRIKPVRRLMEVAKVSRYSETDFHRFLHPRLHHRWELQLQYQQIVPCSTWKRNALDNSQKTISWSVYRLCISNKYLLHSIIWDTAFIQQILKFKIHINSNFRDQSFINNYKAQIDKLRYNPIKDPISVDKNKKDVSTLE